MYNIEYCDKIHLKKEIHEQKMSSIINIEFEPNDDEKSCPRKRANCKHDTINYKFVIFIFQLFVSVILMEIQKYAAESIYFNY